jgi:AcrR family transcriptional regulator
MPATKTSAGKRRSYHHGSLRRALIDAALSILQTEGLDALSLRAAARRAGVSQAAPYHHFENRDDLLAAVAAEGFQRLQDEMKAGIQAAPSASGSLVEAGVAYVCFAVANPALFRIMFGRAQQGAGIHPLRLSAAKEAYETLQLAVDRSLRPGSSDGQIASLRAWSLAHGLATLLIDGAVTMPADVAATARRALSRESEG